MIWYFTKQYWIDELWDKFDKEQNIYKNYQKNVIINTKYWNDLELLLIQYHLSTKKDIMPFEYALKEKTVSNYSSKEKSISVIIPVVLKDFYKLSEYERMEKFADDTIYAVNQIRDRLKKKKLDFNDELLLLDLKKCKEDFLKTYKK